MPPLAAGIFTNKTGFTLIELLIVIVILSISMTFALLHFGDFGRERTVKITAEELAYAIREVRDEAILTSMPYTIQIRQGYYRVLQGNRLQHQKTLPHHIAISTTTLSLDASGTLTPFILYLGTPQKPHLFRLIGQANGLLLIQKVNPSTSSRVP